MSNINLNPDICQKARLSRDSRFDGYFFIAVKTTKIYCRSICPATPPKEANVRYYPSAISAANAGFRPCLRCRPESAPGSPAWKGIDTTLERAIHLINNGALQHDSLLSLAERLGISDRYLRALFTTHLGISPKSYALYQQCLFAKKLLHQTRISITDVALASGFKSIRRFNDCFQKTLQLTPSQIRKNAGISASQATQTIQLTLNYRPPYDWGAMSRFLQQRVIPGLEWCDTERYGRTFEWQDCRGYFFARHRQDKHQFDIGISVNSFQHLKPIVNNIRRILDVDVDMQAVEAVLKQGAGNHMPIKTGLRLPGTWSTFEAGIRAILGQQISVAAAHNLIAILVKQLGERIDKKYVTKENNIHFLFPTPQAIINSDLSFFKMPGSRKNTLWNFAHHALNNKNMDDPEQWLTLKGIGRWTVDYAKMRGKSDPDIFLGGDIGVKNALKKASDNEQLTENEPGIMIATLSPWRSYFTLQLWSQL